MTTGSVTFLPGQFAATLAVSLIDDSDIEGPETAVLQVDSNAGYLVGSPSLATVTVADNDGTVDTAGPRAIAASPAGTVYGAWNHPTVTFSEPIQDGSFTLDDVVSLTGPAGAIALTGVNRLSSTQCDVTFPAQTDLGDYQLRIGPAILDAAGNAMNQDEDATNGEVPDDQDVASVTLAAASPSLDLDAADSSGETGADFATLFTEGGSPVAIADTDRSLTPALPATYNTARGVSNVLLWRNCYAQAHCRVPCASSDPRHFAGQGRGARTADSDASRAA